MWYFFYAEQKSIWLWIKITRKKPLSFFLAFLLKVPVSGSDLCCSAFREIAVFYQAGFSYDSQGASACQIWLLVTTEKTEENHHLVLSCKRLPARLCSFTCLSELAKLLHPTSPPHLPTVLVLGQNVPWTSEEMPTENGSLHPFCYLIQGHQFVLLFLPSRAPTICNIICVWSRSTSYSPEFYPWSFLSLSADSFMNVIQCIFQAWTVQYLQSC